MNFYKLGNQPKPSFETNFRYCRIWLFTADFTAAADLFFAVNKTTIRV